MVEKVDFISGCPAYGCSNGRSQFFWEHHNCGGNEWLDSEGYLECKKCKIRDILLSWKFKCSGHSDFREVNKEKICEILSVASSIEKGSRKFKAKLLIAVGKMME